MNFKFLYTKSSKIIPSIEIIHCFFKFIWHTLVESHLKPFTLRDIMKFPIKVQFPQYAPFIPQTYLTNPSIIQTIILNKQNLPCPPHKLFSSL